MICFVKTFQCWLHWLHQAYLLQIVWHSVLSEPTEYDTYSVLMEAFILHKSSHNCYTIFLQIFIPGNLTHLLTHIDYFYREVVKSRRLLCLWSCHPPLTLWVKIKYHELSIYFVGFVCKRFKYVLDNIHILQYIN